MIRINKEAEGSRDLFIDISDKVKDIVKAFFDAKAEKLNNVIDNNRKKSTEEGADIKALNDKVNVTLDGINPTVTIPELYNELDKKRVELTADIHGLVGYSSAEFHANVRMYIQQLTTNNPMAALMEELQDNIGAE